MQIRRATVDDAGSIARVHVVVQQQAYRDLLPAEALRNVDMAKAEASKRNKLVEDEAGQSCTFVAETDSGEVFGYATGGPRREGPDEYGAELFNIFVLPERQGSGAGSGLFERVTDFLIALGHEGLLLWVIRGTAATRYYERLGGERIGKRDIELAGVPLVMDCYGWKDVRSLQRMLLDAMPGPNRR